MKKLNKKGFTLIELLAVIVILAILVAVAVPAVTRYLNTARKGTYADNASSAISAVRNDVISNFGTKDNLTYSLSDINELLEKKLVNSPYGKAYSSDSYIQVVTDTDGNYYYYVCLFDGTYGIEGFEDKISQDDVGTKSACKITKGSVTHSDYTGDYPQ